MIKLLKQYKLLIISIFLTILLLLGLGYLFAEQKSEPTFATKIDRIMFEKKNHSPKFVITLPDLKQKKSIETKEVIQASPQEVVIHKSENKEFSAIEFANKIPLMSKLKPISDPIPLLPTEIIAELSEKQDNMILPKIASDGRKPWIEYSKKETVQPNFYKVAIVLKNLGMDNMVTTAAIETMPANISLSFSPYATNPKEDVKKAREFGHETYVDWLLCSKNFLKTDSGPLAMSITQSKEENIKRALLSLNVEAPIGGMVVNSGIADENTYEQQKAIMENIKSRGLLIVDATNSEGISKINIDDLPRKKADIVIENKFVRSEIDNLLELAEKMAKVNGSVLIVATPKPVVLHAINDWINTFSPQLSYQQMKEQNIKTVEKPYALVPVSNLVVE